MPDMKPNFFEFTVKFPPPSLGAPWWGGGEKMFGPPRFISMYALDICRKISNFQKKWDNLADFCKDIGIIKSDCGKDLILV